MTHGIVVESRDARVVFGVFVTRPGTVVAPLVLVFDRALSGNWVGSVVIPGAPGRNSDKGALGDALHVVRCGGSHNI